MCASIQLPIAVCACLSCAAGMKWLQQTHCSAGCGCQYSIVGLELAHDPGTMWYEIVIHYLEDNRLTKGTKTHQKPDLSQYVHVVDAVPICMCSRHNNTFFFLALAGMGSQKYLSQNWKGIAVISGNSRNCSHVSCQLFDSTSNKQSK